MKPRNYSLDRYRIYVPLCMILDGEDEKPSAKSFHCFITPQLVDLAIERNNPNILTAFYNDVYDAKIVSRGETLITTKSFGFAPCQGYGSGAEEILPPIFSGVEEINKRCRQIEDLEMRRTVRVVLLQRLEKTVTNNEAVEAISRLLMNALFEDEA